MRNTFMAFSNCKTARGHEIAGRVVTGQIVKGQVVQQVVRNEVAIDFPTLKATVLELEAYRRSVSILAEGMTGLIILQLPGIDDVQQDDILLFQ